MKTYTCIVNVNFWSYETDSYSITSSTGKSFKFWAHSCAISEPTPELRPSVEIFNGIIKRYHEQPIEGEYNARTNYQRDKAMELTTEEMLAFKTVAEACNRADAEARNRITASNRTEARHNARAKRAWNSRSRW